MTASTLSRPLLLAGSALAAHMGRAGLWSFHRYMRAPLASSGLLAMVTMTALAASNALYFQTARHPAPFFAPSPAVPVAVVDSDVEPQPQPMPEMRQTAVLPAVTSPETTGSVTSVPAAAPVIPDAPVGNKDAFAVQKKLTEIGLFRGTVDGFYGPQTATAIRAFETQNGMTPTGALTPGVVDAILKSDTAGRVPVAQQPVPVQPAPVQQAVIQQPVAPAPQVDVVIARVAPVSPIDSAVDTVGNAAASTLDSIVAAVDGGRSTPASTSPAPVPQAALPAVAPVAAPPVQVASLELMAAPRPATAVQSEAVPQNVLPANNVQLVSQIQRGLASLGFYHGSIDGHPGDGTARAIREFENFHSYRVTGQINPDLVGLLRQAGASI
ncbi:MAG: peptidoglycan-binding protein [Candidatus Devosia phytovorans]|uniref:Peptidoglycan-binding protein n=1 Tax=Candidatus Devosia phytovorans TaxID=3121372 RepID=A0AAJ6AZT4_9HYPH|nr:peptidoglycan-binding protein [Devosia sp.]WEK02813.1 MAG: peptidoglycan-binding protein [Devosia sp.]